MTAARIPEANRAYDRRAVLRLAAAGLAGAALWPRYALAATPPHTFKHGAFEISVVSDGHLVLPANLLGPDAPRAELEALLKSVGQGPDLVQPAANITLIRSGADLILVDTGSGANFQPTAGKLAENLEAAGIDKAKITHVVFTHAHPDHLWGTIDDFNELRFPNAGYFVSEAEWNFWMDADLIRKMPDAMHGFVVGAQRNLARIKDRVKAVKPDENIVNGVRVLDTAGHTPGHISLEIAGGDGLIVVGDVVPHTAVSFAHPEWRFAFDAIPELAVVARRQLFDRAAAAKTKLIGYHWPYPGVGYAERKDGAFRFVAG
jgi:glyoxylase-like metal-dependent hydrolase (beta-lactamase superfamily II)